jgi:hypothetical protein
MHRLHWATQLKNQNDELVDRTCEYNTPASERNADLPCKLTRLCKYINLNDFLAAPGKLSGRVNLAVANRFSLESALDGRMTCMQLKFLRHGFFGLVQMIS